MKRELTGYDADAKATGNPTVRDNLRFAFNQKSVELKAKQAELKDFLRQTELRRDTFREQAHGFGRSQASKSSWAARKSSQKVIANSGGRGIMAVRAIDALGLDPQPVDWNAVNAKSWKRKFVGLFGGKKVPLLGMSHVDHSVFKRAKEALRINDGTNGETLFAVSLKDGKVLKTIQKRDAFSGDDLSVLEKIKERYVLVHNHPNSSPLGLDDLTTLNTCKNMESIMAVGHDGGLCGVRTNGGIKLPYNVGKREIGNIYRCAIRDTSNYSTAVEMVCREMGWTKYGR